MEDRIYMDVAVGSSLDENFLTLISEVKVRDTYYVLSEKIINLEEQAIRDALVSLGWTPPGVGV